MSKAERTIDFICKINLHLIASLFSDTLHDFHVFSCFCWGQRSVLLDSLHNDSAADVAVIKVFCGFGVKHSDCHAPASAPLQIVVLF